MSEDSAAKNRGLSEGAEGTVMLAPIPDEVSGPVMDDLGHYLTVLSGEDRGQRFRIGKQPVILGRRQVDIVIQDPAVSGRHCRVSASGDDLRVEDLGSSNGTFIDGKKVGGAARLPVGHTLRLGSTEMRHEYRSSEELRKSDELGLDLDRAAFYVESLLPPILVEADVEVGYRFRPSSKLGGDAFCYQWLDDDHLALYVIDVCGHGVRSSLHAVSAVQLLRAGSLAGVDFRQPGAVLGGLNDVFQMEQHGGMYFTAWYGVYVRSERRLRFASAGHPPALLLGGEGPRQLSIRQPAIGMMEDLRFTEDEVELPPDARLFVFSDGAYELSLGNGETWTLDGFLDLLGASHGRPPEDELDAIEARLLEIQGHDRFEDDLSLLLADFRARALAPSRTIP